MRQLSSALIALISFVSTATTATAERVVPDMPEADQRIRLVIDSDAA